ncbi:MAG: helix-turn-helix transcriptional regulator [Chloroflexi bacterium]|nr:MAG: helix-turn-helix transcriptional regulator [Chloroflexota bacterium]
MAIAESQAGRLEVAHALASESQRLGDRGEPFQAVGHDLEGLTRLAMGDRVDFELLVPNRICEPTGPSPVGTWEMLLYVMPLLPLRGDEVVGWAARLAGLIAARIASPRWQLQSDSWRVAAELNSGNPGSRGELAGLVARARRATPGLKALPVYLQGLHQRRYESFEEAERLARRSGNVWLQISALTWMTALDPKVRPAKRLRQLLEITGWRRLVLVPSETAADAALGMTSMGERSEAVLELALTADRPNVTTELVAKVGKAAANTNEGPAYGLSEREIEVLSLAADGLTNKQIGEKLFLSPHTIARHVANARAKLGASNRAEAAVLLHRTAS